MKPTHAEMISEVIKELREPFTTKEIVDAVVRKYSAIRPINRRSLGTDIAGCCANLRSHRHLPDLPVLLVSVGRGKYRRFDPRRDMDLLERVQPEAGKSTWEVRRKISIEFRIDEKKAAKIAETLLGLFYRRKGFFEGYSMPEYILPRNLGKGSREHALYLTYVISVDYMTDAEDLWRRSRRAYELYPERFEPAGVLALDTWTLQRFVREVGARFPSAGADTWRRISKILLEKYNGDPRNITRQPLTIEEIKGRLDEFPYLRGNKLSNFYIRAMGENELLKVRNFDELDIPVDKQVARLTIYTGVLELLSERFEGCVHEDPLRSLIEKAWRNAAKAENTHPWKLDEPIWTIGSKLCTRRKCNICPVEEHCNKTRGIRFRNGIIIWERR